MSSSTVINHLTEIFEEHGIPERLISDNGPQYSSEEFRVFSARYGFDHDTSSPLYPRSNGFIEKTVQTVKKLFTKAKESGGDPHLVMLCLRTTPIDHNLPSPCELLNGRRYKQNLPAISSRSDGNINAFPQQRQDIYKSYHDRTAKELAPLSPQQTVRVLNPIRKTWDLAKVTNKASTPRSYNILTHKEPRTCEIVSTCVIHKDGKSHPRIMVSMTTSKTIERLHNNPNLQWQSATHNALKQGDPVE